MYDKTKLFMLRCSTTPDVSVYLDNGVEQVDIQTGEVKTFGSVGGLRVSSFTSGISIIGSLAKYMYGNNIYPLDRHTTAQAIEKLSDDLHLDLSEAKVTGLEFGTHFAMSKPVAVYLRKLGDAPRLIRTSLTEDTIYYKPKGKHQSKVLCFYDKAMEADVKDVDVPDGLSDANLLRYEIRWNGRLSKQLDVPEVLAKTLSDKNFYKRLVELWQKHYFAISKTNELTLRCMERIKNVSDAFDVFVARLISQCEPSSVKAFLDELKDARTFTDRKNYTRLKKKIDGVTKKVCVDVDTDLQELDDDIKNAGAYI